MRFFLVSFFFASIAFAQNQPADMEKDLQLHPEKLGTRIQLANIYLKQKDYPKVIGLLNSYTDQLTPEGFLALANAYSNRKEYVDEVRVLKLLVIKQSENYRWHFLLGQAFLKQIPQQTDYIKKKDVATSAIQSFRKALQLQKDFKPAFDYLLTTLLQQKANHEARELLHEGMTKFGERPELFSELCRLDAIDGFLDSAIKACRDGIKLAPKYPDNYVFLIQAFYDQKEEKKAEATAVAAGKRFPNSEFVQWAAGTLFFKKKNFPVAGRYFQAAVKASPNSSRAHFGLAQSMFESGQEVGSLPHFIKACAADVTTVETFLAAGGKLKQKGNQALGEKFVSSAYNCKN